MKTMTQPQMAEFDAAELKLMQKLAAAEHELARLIDAAHRQAGDTRSYSGRGSSRVTSWQLTDEEAVRAAGLAGSVSTAGYQVASLRTNIDDMEAVYREAPWTRWFKCTNADGHIHSSLRGCPTVRFDTGMTWFTDMSGQDVAAAVADPRLGPTLCSVCFPDAPAEHCRSLSDITRAGREAAKAARQEAKYIKQLRPDEAALLRSEKPYSGPITTVNGCLEEIRTEVEFRDYYGRGEHPFHSQAVRGAQAAVTVLLHRERTRPGTGKTQQEIDAIIRRAVKKNIKDGARLDPETGQPTL
jgi:hypothetical protein